MDSRSQVRREIADLYAQGVLTKRHADPCFQSIIVLLIHTLFSHFQLQSVDIINGQSNALNVDLHDAFLSSLCVAPEKPRGPGGFIVHVQTKEATLV